MSDPEAIRRAASIMGSAKSQRKADASRENLRKAWKNPRGPDKKPRKKRAVKDQEKPPT